MIGQTRGRIEGLSDGPGERGFAAVALVTLIMTIVITNTDRRRADKTRAEGRVEAEWVFAEEHAAAEWRLREKPEAAD